jgi:ubiquinone/menaquinone biosynthesis C-methylase UbiE
MADTEGESPVEQARRRFDLELHTDAYRRIHEDPSHLDSLMNLMDAQPGQRYLDLGTGNGYLAFEIARRFPDAVVTGVDIAARSIDLNQKLQRERGVSNLDFVSYEGTKLPFSDGLFAGVVSRYAFHHFADPKVSVQELRRITEPDGFVIISDPITYEDDADGFIDRFQRVKADGHVHFHRPAELDALFGRQGFAVEARSFGTISYPRELSEPYLRLIESTPASILQEYRIEVQESSVRATVSVQDVRYRKAVTGTIMRRLRVFEEGPG